MPGAIVTQINSGMKAEQQETALDLRCQGKTIRAIAAIMHLSKSTVENRIKDAINERLDEPVAEVIKMEIARYERYLDKLEPKIAEGDPQAINAAMKIGDRRARLLGLDAPTRIDARVAEVTQLDMEAEEMLREAQVRAAARKAALMEDA